jgi:hypothetical protein
LQFQNKLRSPTSGVHRILRCSEAIDVSAVLGDQYEIKEIALNELRFILGPQRAPLRSELDGLAGRGWQVCK